MSGYPCKDCGVFGHYDGPVCNSCLQTNRINELCVELIQVKDHNSELQAFPAEFLHHDLILDMINEKEGNKNVLLRYLLWERDQDTNKTRLKTIIKKIKTLISEENT